MKKRMYFVLVAVVMFAICLTFTGCGQKVDKQDTDKPGYNFDTGDSTIMDGTNNPDTSEDETDYPLGNDESIPDGGAEATAGNLEGYGTRNPDGTYTWQVGNYQLTTKINVLDYVDTNTHVWRVNDMATALGWDKNKSMAAQKPLSFDMDDTNDAHISFSAASDRCNGIELTGNNFTGRQVSLPLPIRQSDNFTFNNEDFTMSFDGIVCFAYICECLNDDPACDPFDGIFYASESRGNKSYSYTK